MAFQNTKEALRRVASELLSIANQGQSHVPGNTGPTLPATSSTSPTLPATSSTSNRGTSTPVNRVQEHMKIFNYGKGRSAFAGKGKGPAKKKMPTCTLKFFCLGNPQDERPPSAIAARTALSNAGLGPANIVFELNGLPVHQGLLNRYPLLESAGGYELLLYQRGGIDQGFHAIPKAQTPSRLKEIACQATIYIRPLQVDILEIAMEGNSEAQENETETEVPKVECLKCHELVNMDLLRTHQEQNHSRKRKHQATLHLEVLSDDSDGSVDDNENKINKKQDFPSTSKHPTDADEIQQLAEMFPNKSISELTDCLNSEGSCSNAANVLLSTIVPDDDDYNSDKDADLMIPALEPKCLKTELQNLKKNFSLEEKVKLKIDEDDLLQDAMAYYKDSEFDPKRRLRVIYNGQAAADTGGVIRQFYTQLLSAISNTFFQGETHCIPIYNSEMVASGIMKLVGTIIVHSILQGGPGFPVFSLAVYHYLAKGDLQEAVKSVTVADCSTKMNYMISKIAGVFDVADLDQEEIISTLSECGMTVALTNDNKVRVIQSLIVHDAIGKPKIVLDQLREGLQTLGFGSRMKQNPEIFKELFVAGNKEIQGEQVKRILVFPAEMSDDERKTKLFLEEFVASATLDALKEFLTFATGAPCLPEFGLGTIKIEFSDVTSVFSSTCLKKLTFPRKFPDKDMFAAALQAVCNNAGKAFTSV